jgi:hypothetical protein
MATYVLRHLPNIHGYLRADAAIPMNGQTSRGPRHAAPHHGSL